MKSKAGYEEVEHTADRAVRVWAPDMPALLRQAALGMYALMGIVPQDRFDSVRELVIPMTDDESLMVGFLSELLIWLETERMVASSIDAMIEDGKMVYRLAGYRHARARVAVKAVTYYDLRVVRNEEGLQATVVFDV
jgi:SHS2 domain-containing protein